MATYAEVEEVETQLEAMGLTLTGLTRVVSSAIGGFTSTTRFHASASGGTYLYHEATAALRRLVMPLGGWDHDEEDRQPRTYSVERGIAIVVQSGDENTGIKEPEAEPRARHPKGSATARKVVTNSEQLALFPVPHAGRPNQAAGEMLTWVLMICVEGEVARAELSLPRQMSADGRPCGWVHRIVLPELPLGATPEDFSRRDTPPGTDVDVDVEWKQ